MRSLSVRRLACLPLLLPTAAMAQAQATSAPASVATDPLPTDSAVTIGTLPNGMRYYLRLNKEPEKRAELRLVVNAGSILEEENQRGLAHFLEHMAFNGSSNFERQQLIEYMESIGMRFGGDVNASTTYDHTLYRLTVPTDAPGALERGLLILEDWAHGITLDNAAIENERPVILSERRSQLGAGTRIRLHTDSALLGGSRYLDRSPIGLPHIIETAPRAELLRFYKDWYRPDLMAVVVVGDIDTAATTALIRRHFGRISAPRRPRERARFTIPDQPEPVVTIVTDPEATGRNVQIVQKYRPSPVNSAARAREGIVEGMFQSVLNQRLREIATRGESPFLGASTDFGAFVGGWRTHTVVSVSVRENELELGLQAALTEVERIAQHGITEAELDREKRAARSRYDQALITRSKISSATHANAYVNHFLSGATPTAVEASVARARALLATITLDDVAALARRWRGRENLAVIAMLPEKEAEAAPTAEVLLAVLDAVEGTRLLAEREAVVALASLVEHPPTPGTVVEERTIREVGITEWTLSNGMRVFLKPTRHSPDQVVLSGYGWGGTSLLPDSVLPDAALARLLPALSGLGSFSSTGLRNAMVGKLVTAGMQIGTYSQHVSGNSTVRDLEALLQLVYLHFTAPRVDSQAVRAWQRRVRTSIEGREAAPQSHFQDTLSVTLTQSHPRGQPLRIAQIDSIDFDRALAIYKESFADGGDFTFVIVGSFDTDSVRPLVARYLGGIPARADGKAGWRDTGVRYPTGVVEKEFHFGREPRSRTAIVFNGPYVHGEDDAFAMGAMARVLTTRLRDRLREDLGGTYSVNVRAAVHSVPERGYTIHIEFDAAPERADELREAVFAEVERLRASGPTNEEVQTVREESIRQLELAVENNRFWLQSITNYIQMDRPLEALATYQAPLEKLTPAQVQAMARQYLNPARYVRVTQLPGQ